ncbi:MAG TPA: hypothetical protein VJI75_01940, partial [Candidatus Nanoarchaeia archaeon]|nr:hypothetical protein [Candidatus Nanoarchaeia archaeon]
MLDVTKSESNMRSYLSDGLVKKEPFKQIVYDTLMRNHKESLQLADELFSERRSTLWTIVISYYSMFYIASAALYKRGYKIGDRGAHKIAADGLVVVLRNRLAKSLFEEYD